MVSNVCSHYQVLFICIGVTDTFSEFVDLIDGERGSLHSVDHGRILARDCKQTRF